jgi:hypothetical protein
VTHDPEKNPPLSDRWPFCFVQRPQVVKNLLIRALFGYPDNGWKKCALTDTSYGARGTEMSVEWETNSAGLKFGKDALLVPAIRYAAISFCFSPSLNIEWDSAVLKDLR